MDFDKLEEALNAWDRENLDCGSFADFRDERSAELAAAFSEGYTAGRDGEERRKLQDVSEAWSNGLQFGARTMQDQVKKDLGEFVLRVLGKDLGDGEINLGALGKFYAEGA